jgi:muramoyltetrapeptide carboxypeptidase LdcA involved in peptidoglycan recycling
MNRKLRRAAKAIGRTLGLPAPKDPNSIQRSYAEACARLGDLTYKIAVGEEGLDKLRKEAADIQKGMKDLSSAFSQAMTEQQARSLASKEEGAPSSPSSPSKE